MASIIELVNQGGINPTVAAVLAMAVFIGVPLGLWLIGRC